MVTISPYLTFNGNCEEAFNFYKSIFGGDFTMVSRFKEMPPGGGPPVPPSEGEKIMHMSLPISKEVELMGSDTFEVPGQPKTIVGNNISISINVDTAEDAKRIFNGLAAGGKIIMPLDKTFWSSLFGMLTDKFGINWMMSYNEEK